MVCAKRHTFDLARTGYINLLTGKKGDAKYTKELFEARRAVYRQGLFTGLLQRIIAEVEAWSLANAPEHLRILDVGCGEGSHLWTVVTQLTSQGKDVLGVGLDIAKEGIQVAARHYPGLLWCVGDLAHAPLASGEFHVILNILSPANYNEFARLLAGNGMVVKVVPGRNYLREVRIGLYGETAVKSEGERDVAPLFARQFAQVRQVEVEYRVEVAREHLPALVDMTPLSWMADPSAKAAFIAQGPHEVTIHAEILMGEGPK